jgi:cytidyltransferase-like protein
MAFVKKTFWVDKSTGEIRKTMSKKKYKVILVSGGFDPVHKGHLEMIAEARKLADEVWVILNNDNWLRQKKGQAFMKEKERQYIMSQIKGVTETFILNPRTASDKTVCDGIYSAVMAYRRKFKGKMKMAFGNGGDRVEKTIPEAEYCSTMNVDMVWGLGKKIQSSSWLLEKFNNQENDYWEYSSNQGRSSQMMEKKYKLIGWSLLGLIITTLIILLTQ